MYPTRAVAATVDARPSMAHPGFGHLWQQEDMSDVDIVISVAEDTTSADGETSEAQNSTRTFLQQFPGHSLILSYSPYFKAQALRWMATPQSQGSSQTGVASSTQQARKQISITLPDTRYEPAAMAVLAVLYQVKPWPELLADLTPQQQVHAAVLADMWQLSAALQQTLDKPDSSYSSPFDVDFTCLGVPPTLQAAVLNQLLSLAAVPASLLPVFESALLSTYGELDVVWSAEASFACLQESLLQLPLYAMELLLASDKLKVASEDTVLFTAQAYVDNLAAEGGDTQQAVDTLAPLVCCPHLSQLWLSATVLSDDAPRMLLHALQPQLRRLLQLELARSRSAGLGRASASLENLQQWIPTMPTSWLLPQRNIKSITLEEVFWRLDVAAIRQAAQDSASQQRDTILKSTRTCLLGGHGIMWGMELRCSWDASKQGSTLGLYIRANSLPAGSICVCTYCIDCIVLPGPGEGWVTERFCGDHATTRGQAEADIFGLGAMAGGFDEAAWAARGLPMSGRRIMLQLTVKDVDV